MRPDLWNVVGLPNSPRIAQLLRGSSSRLIAKYRIGECIFGWTYFPHLLVVAVVYNPGKPLASKATWIETGD